MRLGILASALALTLAFDLAGAALAVAGMPVTMEYADWGFPGFNAAIGLAAVLLGWPIARTRPRNPIGWLLVAIGVLSLVLAAAYVGGVLLLSRLLEPFVEQAGGLVVAGSTLAVAALFQPARRRIQATVDRRFDRTLYDATAIAEELSASLREAVELEGVRDQVLTAVERTMRPTSVSLWLRPRGQ